MKNKLEKINDINIHYQIDGEDNEKTIVFIHGLSDDLNYWIPIKTVFKDYKRISYDLRGHGQSEFGNKDVTIDTYKDDLYKLLIKLNVKEAVFIGFSLGGNVALKIGIEHPEMTKGLILMSTFSQMIPNLEKTFKIFEKSIKNSYELFYETILDLVLPDELLIKHKDYLEEIKKEKAKTANINGILAGIIAGPKFYITDKLNKIQCPVLILAGENDDITNIEIQNILKENINNSKLIILENTKHNLLIGRNIPKINNSIKEFLDKNY